MTNTQKTQSYMLTFFILSGIKEKPAFWQEIKRETGFFKDSIGNFLVFPLPSLSPRPAKLLQH